ncbi:MAG: Ig-like domain-containing protein [Myxococcota bacterium]
MKRLAPWCCLALAACSEPAPPPKLPPAPPGPGVVFAWPRDGQFDVPNRARLLVTFSEPPDATALATPCARTGATVTGGLCVEGPGGFVPGTPRAEGNTVVFEGTWAEGETYRVYATPALLPAATNLDATRPLVTFTARDERPHAQRAPRLVTLNEAPPDAGALPFLDVAPLRLLFSEPLDPGTVDATHVQLLGPDGGAVDGLVLCHGAHLTFDPNEPLEAGAPYRLVLSSAVHDLGGEALDALSLPLVPTRAASADGALYEQRLVVSPPGAEATSLPASPLAPMRVNSTTLRAQLIGENTLLVREGGLVAKLGDPAAFGGPIPLVLPRGQRIDLSSMQIHFGGVLESGLQTGTLHFTLLSDASGFLTRNPFRPADQLPDDARAPVFVDLTMDALVTSEDAHGNVLATQTVMGIRLLGTSTVDGEQLLVDQVGALDFDTLGVGTAPVNLALRLRTGGELPTALAPASLASPSLIATFPAAGARDVPPDTRFALHFTGPLDPSRLRDGVELTLTQNTARVPVIAYTEGATLVVRPQQRLGDGLQYSLSLTGLRSFGGAPLGALPALTFQTATLSTAAPAPPIVTAAFPGAPCALVRASSTAPGSCAGGKNSDAPYLPFTLAANLDARVQFSQPMNAASVTLGTTCGSGSVRVERLDAAGACVGVVRGTLRVEDRQLRFTPDAPWTAGTRYRLTLVGGNNDSCGAGELCSRAGKPLNTDPLAGAKGGQGGGPDLVIGFTGAPPTEDNLQPLESNPFADQNGNGQLDAEEDATDENRAAMEISGRGGVVTAASLNGPDCVQERPGQQSCSYLHATLPVTVDGVRAQCPIDAQGRPSTAAVPCIEVRVFPNTILGTSLSMNTTAIGIVPLNDLPTGALVMRIRETGAPAYGFILTEAGKSAPQFVINQKIYLDAPDLSILAGTVPHDLSSKELDVTLKGPVTFRADGRMDVALRNTEDVTLTVNISALLIPGRIEMTIPAGQMRITLAGPLLR